MSLHVESKMIGSCLIFGDFWLVFLVLCHLVSLCETLLINAPWILPFWIGPFSNGTKQLQAPPVSLQRGLKIIYSWIVRLGVCSLIGVMMFSQVFLSTSSARIPQAGMNATGFDCINSTRYRLNNKEEGSEKQ